MMISASIVTYKSNPDVLRRTIASYLSGSYNSKLYVVDNSLDQSAMSLCHHPSIEYIGNRKNIGYGRAHNIAINKAIGNSKYHLILNPDISFDERVLPELVRFLDENDDVGLVMPRVTLADGKLQFLCKLLPSPYQLFTRRLLSSIEKIARKINFEYEMHFTGYSSVIDAPFLSGCFMLIRSEALRKVGFFDERFFLFFEDTDLSRRINQRFRTVYYPKVTIVHSQAHSGMEKLKRLGHALVSGCHYFNKWGWFLDEERKRINRSILMKYRVNGYAKNLRH